MRVQRLPSRLKMWLTPMRPAPQVCCTAELAEVCLRSFSSPDASLVSSIHPWRSILGMFGRLAAHRWTASNSAGWWFCCLVPQDTRMRYSLLDQTNMSSCQHWLLVKMDGQWHIPSKQFLLFTCLRQVSSHNYLNACPRWFFGFFKLQYLGSSIPENRSMTTETSIVACPFVPIMGSRLELALRIFGHPKESNQSTLAALAP